MSGGDAAQPLTLEEKRARLEQLRQADKARAAAAEEAKLDAELERYELVERLTRELGEEGKAFALFDGTSIGAGLIAVKPGPAILWKTYWDSQMTDVDKCDLIRACVVHPSAEKYLEVRANKPAIDIPLVTLLGRLYGLITAGAEKK